MGNIVIVGSGHAGYQLAAALRHAGNDDAVFLVGDEPHLPYQRPPLSKDYLKTAMKPEDLRFWSEEQFAEKAIKRIAGVAVTAIDRAAGAVSLSNGHRLGFDRLVLATGTRNRVLPVPGGDRAGIYSLRTVDDAERIRAALENATSAVVIGGGFIGLEIAATIAERGVPVTVVEAAGRVMGRVVGEAVSRHHERVLGALGVGFRFHAKVAGILGPESLGSTGRVEAVLLGDGERLEADIVIVGIGVLPNQELAVASDLAAGDGILVDAGLATADPRIFAIGDVARHPSLYASAPVRIESVQNATDQARLVAARLAGKPAGAYGAVPWFWSHQGSLKLQIAGLGHEADETVLRGRPEDGAFSAFRFRAGRLVAVESVDRPTDHMAARRLLAGGTMLTPGQAADESFDLKALAMARPQTG
ncbi:3-phenylpropionate/trans-cinnamate dioxygenase ferredoxin reductase subunit [Pseudoxanthobacter soli DSM 19599]|uniref:3-phenylpropionate/trans-cinnamate dioxygenase ferredoxin reductase subunit n=1 Tax=Pseudoxanthobacter soli DSM 19599 TaxID=1123029 RepID=A0A1M7ZKT9_9HYPH|nr:FAD-dependent oxidoreductase [Pseudoxanthobacter soli]SHO65491.1 3-phenylpropionate/trans-cinnamate dioxygenase ferredoxin reductase subunit [Pseudoxanthobacter soli DSM 19599]